MNTGASKNERRFFHNQGATDHTWSLRVIDWMQYIIAEHMNHNDTKRLRMFGW